MLPAIKMNPSPFVISDYHLPTVGFQILDTGGFIHSTKKVSPPLAFFHISQKVFADFDNSNCYECAIFLRTN